MAKIDLRWDIPPGRCNPHLVALVAKSGTPSGLELSLTFGQPLDQADLWYDQSGGQEWYPQ